jgi:ankyrin repeat protein
MMTSADEMYGAIARGDTASVRELVVRDPSVLDTYFLGKSWLHWAAQNGHTEIMAVLVQPGLSVDQLTGDGVYTPLKKAAGQGQYGACEWLLDHGADINHGLGISPTPVFGAIYSKSLELVELLGARGANLGATFGDPRIDVITYAQNHGTPEIVNCLRTHMQRAGLRLDKV